jgi:SAM-dependent methyltransferase
VSDPFRRARTRLSEPRFVAPDPGLYRDPAHAGDYGGVASSYAAYNYFGGLASRVKRAHFGAALHAARAHEGGTAIDFGCADGILLPSLSRRYERVWAIDLDPGFVATARRVVEHHELANVTLTCNAGGALPALPPALDGGADVLFALETVEHVGERERMWESRADVLEGLFALVRPGGEIVITVPTMVGPAFLVQRAALRALGLRRERRISRGELLRAGLLWDTDALEPRWKAPSGHLGFNHVRLQRAIAERFEIVRKRHLVFQVLYVIRRREPSI